MTASVETFLDSYKPEVKDITLQIRELVRSIMPDAREQVQPNYKTITYGSGQGMSDQICYIAPLSTSVNLGFHFGTQLPDPNKLLRGTGKRLRHIKLESPEDLNNPAIRTLLQVAKTQGKF